ncbi:MAG: AMP-binding protein, partial [Ginsengibacter sp.]
MSIDKMNEAFNITSLFAEAAKKNPGKTAIIFKDKKISFTELEKQIDKTAQYFLSKKIGKGDRVLIFLPMSIHLYRIVLALFKIGAIAVFLDEWVSKKRMEECCKVAECKAFIAIFKVRLLSNFSNELRKIPIKLTPDFTSVKQHENTAGTVKDDIALITFTTGSTGIPKAAIRTHGILYNQFNALKEKINPEERDVSMTTLPIVLLINLATGTTSVIAPFKASTPSRVNYKKIITPLVSHLVNSLIASPFFIKGLSKHIIQKGISLPGIEKIFTGGAPVFPAEGKLYLQAFPRAKIEVVYGSTEAEPISSINIEALVSENNFLREGLDVGKVAACAQVKIIQMIDDIVIAQTEDDLRNIEMPVKGIGEIIVSGNHVLQEYLNNEMAIKRNKIFIGSICWHRTGDSGYIDEAGTLYLTGRCNTIIREANKIYYPFLFENYFQAIQGVEMGT